MNYLETGLPHTEFYPKKTQFNPPRFIPLCQLGRKYLGLEPMTKREVKQLINRLSEPKRLPLREETTEIKALRPKSTGTGRFVGEKKMDSFQIEKMVTRLYSRRTTKDYAFVDETVEADDVLNMTNRLDESSDSDTDNDDLTDNRISVSRKHVSCAKQKSSSENEELVECTSRSKVSVDFSSGETPKPKVEFKVTTDRPFRKDSALRSTSIVSENNCLRRQSSEGNLLRQSNYAKRANVEIAKMSKFSKRCYNRSKSESSLKLGLPVTVNKKEHDDGGKQGFQTGTPRLDNNKRNLSLALGSDHVNEIITSQPNSPGRTLAKADEIKSPRVSPRFSCDEQLIAKVATYNRSPRVRCR